MIKKIIVYRNIDKLEVWHDLKKLCKAKGFKYSTLSKKKMPIIIGESYINRLQCDPEIH